MKKRMTQEQFQLCTQGLDVGQQTLDIARGVLVEGKPQTTFIESTGLSRGAVSQAVNRIWKAWIECNVPPGHVRVSVVLPEHRAYIVQKWSVEVDPAKSKEPHE